jgi:hypothetical protein
VVLVGLAAPDAPRGRAPALTSRRRRPQVESAPLSLYTPEPATESHWGCSGGGAGGNMLRLRGAVASADMEALYGRLVKPASVAPLGTRLRRYASVEERLAKGARRQSRAGGGAGAGRPQEPPGGAPLRGLGLLVGEVLERAPRRRSSTPDGTKRPSGCGRRCSPGGPRRSASGFSGHPCPTGRSSPASISRSSKGSALARRRM